MPYDRSQAEEADIDSQGYLDQILNYFRSPAQANTMQPESNSIMFDSAINAEPVGLQELRENDKIYGNSEDFNSKSGEILNNIVNPVPVIQPQAPVIPQQPSRDTLMRFQSRNINPPREEAPPVMAPIPAPAPPIEAKAAPAREVSQAPVEAQEPDGSIFNSISNTLKDVSKSASDTFNDPAFRQGLGGILVAIGAGFQGQDASKSLERYHNSILNDKQEARRKALEEEQRVKKDPNSVWNLTYREMIKKSLPGVDKLMGPSFDNMTEEMLRQNYPMISSSMTKMTEKELSNPSSSSSIDAVKSYNEMISSFGGKIKLLEEGKYSAKDVDKFMSNLNNVIQYNHQEDQKDFNKSKLEEDIRQFNERQKQEQAFKKEDLGIKRDQLSFEKMAENRKYGLEVNKFNYSKQKDAELRKLMKQKMEIQQSATGAQQDKEQRRLLEKYPSGIVLSGVESAKLNDKQTGYTKMKSALDNLENLMNRYGAPMSPTSSGYAEINSAWSQYVAAIKEAEELGALDNGVSKLANETLPNPTKINPIVRISGGEPAVKQNTVNILKNMRNQYRDQYAKNTAMYGFNPELSADENTRYMDEYTDSNTPKDRQVEIYKSIYKNLGYDKKLFNLYAGNYVKRRQLFTGVK